jgi:hypothetical protein
MSLVDKGGDTTKHSVVYRYAWMRADLYPGDVLIVPPFVWHMVLSDPDGIAHAAMCRVHFVIFSVHIVRMQCAHGQTAGQQLSGSVCMM